MASLSPVRPGRYAPPQRRHVLLVDPLVAPLALHPDLLFFRIEILDWRPEKMTS